jgi:hypothetical protein
MNTNALARKAFDVTQATALAAVSTRRWANIFAHVYCDLLGRADDAEVGAEARLMGIDAGALERLADLAEDGDDDACLAETVRVLKACSRLRAPDEEWLVTIRKKLGLDDADTTILAR